jgi:hypothetical protein
VLTSDSRRLECADKPRSGVLTSGGPKGRSVLLASELGGEVFDGFAVFEVLFYYVGYVSLRDAEVPGATRVDDEVRAVLAEAEAAHGVDADVPVHALRAQFVFEGAADGLGAALLAVAALADEYVGGVVADLRVRLLEGRERALLPWPLLRLPASLRDGFLRF